MMLKNLTFELAFKLFCIVLTFSMRQPPALLIPFDTRTSDQFFSYQHAFGGMLGKLNIKAQR